jgi:hypothetical protein
VEPREATERAGACDARHEALEGTLKARDESMEGACDAREEGAWEEARMVEAELLLLPW